MKTQTISTQKLYLYAAILLMASLSPTVKSVAQTPIGIPNGDFSALGNDGTIGGLIGNNPRQFLGPSGLGPWAASSDGIDLLFLPDLAAPVVDITGGAAGDLTFGGLEVTNVVGLGLLSTTAEAFATTSTAFLANSVYTLTFDIASSTTLSASLFSDLGFNVSLTAGGLGLNPGTAVANTILDPSILDLNLLLGTSGTGTLTFTTGAVAPTGNIGVLVEFGNSTGALDVNALGEISFDNFGLSVAPVPEPGSAVMLALGMALLFRRRSRNLHA